jgi:hypothetical protein
VAYSGRVISGLQGDLDCLSNLSPSTPAQTHSCLLLFLQQPHRKTNGQHLERSLACLPDEGGAKPPAQLVPLVVTQCCKEPSERLDADNGRPAVCSTTYT